MKAKIDNTEKLPAGCRVSCHVWIEGPRGTLLGLGRTLLLQQIGQTGSIAAAARNMGMSYRRAWQLIDSMNRQFDQALVTRTAGGRGGGGSTLTPAGKHAIEIFQNLDEDFRQFARRHSGRLGAEAAG